MVTVVPHVHFTLLSYRVIWFFRIFCRRFWFLRHVGNLTQFSNPTKVKSAWHDPPHRPPFLFQTHCDFSTQSSVIFFWLLWWNFGVNILITLGEINGNVAWKLENVVTTLEETNNISTIFSLITSKRDTSLQFFLCRWDILMKTDFICKF